MARALESGDGGNVFRKKKKMMYNPTEIYTECNSNGKMCERPLKTLKHFMNLVLLLLLSRFRRVRLCATPSMAAHQAPPSLGFSRQEHWSGLPLPSPVHESAK